MEAKVQKTILGKKIRSFDFYKQTDYRTNKEMIHGFVWLEDGERIHVIRGQYHILNNLGQVSGIVLKSNPGYKQIKRMIARWFQTYRKGGKSFFRERVSTLREACQQAQYSLNIKMIERGQISFNHYFTAS
ncbi:Uncharacterised protein [Chryseobacterium gleum]|uniref:Uncharacterized protein n=2 Tax=Chryseobacterium gleum TaxID=250 RepID=A0A448B7V9_CHRGE|nr:hypothetical protein [Chryseobacterium gleum]EFK36854.1 hypothetical protein HMPREF0204_11411 [Chryseobacterium gleum ATCC 35910]QQY32103.1 hypothetical protein I6I60_25280 [Chryseobacterium gleum]VEE10673.1 Uncharacterised protein [Chryseobacterium gleum]